MSALSDIWKGLKNDAVFQLCKVAGLLRLAPCVLREPPSLVDASPAHQLFKEKLTGRSVQRYFIIGATNLATGAGDLYHFPPSKALVNDAFMDRVDASCEPPLSLRLPSPPCPLSSHIRPSLPSLPSLRCHPDHLPAGQGG